MRTLNFEELNLSKTTLDQLKNNNLTEATALQQAILSHFSNDKSIVICAEEESENDKHTALSIAALEALHKQDATGTGVIIITGSAKASRAICKQMHTLGMDETDCICADDEGAAEEQAEAFRKEPAVIVANPNRLQQLLKEHRFIFRNVGLLVLDIDKQMLADGHAKNLKRIRRRILSEYNAVICSPAYDDEVKDISLKFADEPAVISFKTSAENEASGTPPPIAGHIAQGYINVPYRMKISTLMAHIDQAPNDRCVIFTASKRGTDRLYRVLKKRQLKATSLHGKLSEKKRVQRFSNFTNSDVQYLLVSDISAAELAVDRADQVINYDVPGSPDEYRFRAALVGSSKAGRIVSLVSKQDRGDISELQNELGQTPDEIPLPKEVKKKLKQRKNKKSTGRSKRSSKPKQKAREMHLPQPRYDKLSGGRNGRHDKKKAGLVKFFKKLFS